MLLIYLRFILNFLVILVISPTTNATVYLVKIPNRSADVVRASQADHEMQIPFEIFQEPLEIGSLEREYNNHETMTSKILLETLLRLIGDNLKNIQIKKTKDKKCNRQFGSMYGSKTQKLLCNEKIKSVDKHYRSIRHKNGAKLLLKLKQHMPTYQRNVEGGKTFIDVKRDDVSPKDFRSSRREKYNPYYRDFSRDYIDFNNLRSKPLDFFDNTLQMNKNSHLGDLRKAGKIAIEKNNAKIRPYYDSESSDSDDSPDEEKKKGKRYKISKRFKVIENGESDSDSSIEQERKVKEKNEVGVKYLYLQGGNKIIDINIDEYRRRLEHFMPKRFYWNAEDIENLGYYWFNGPRGKYS